MRHSLHCIGFPTVRIGILDLRSLSIGVRTVKMCDFSANIFDRLEIDFRSIPDRLDFPSLILKTQPVKLFRSWWNLGRWRSTQFVSFNDFRWDFFRARKLRNATFLQSAENQRSYNPSWTRMFRLHIAIETNISCGTRCQLHLHHFSDPTGKNERVCHFVLLNLTCWFRNALF